MLTAYNKESESLQTMTTIGENCRQLCRHAEGGKPVEPEDIRHSLIANIGTEGLTTYR
jgi:hypothetical protein